MRGVARTSASTCGRASTECRTKCSSLANTSFTPRAEAAPRAEAGELVTLIDMDHFVEGNFDADPDWVVARAYELHDHIIETFQGHVVTEDAIEEWK